MWSRRKLVNGVYISNVHSALKSVKIEKKTMRGNEDEKGKIYSCG